MLMYELQGFSFFYVLIQNKMSTSKTSSHREETIAMFTIIILFHCKNHSC